jgi:hypothetical protein
MSYRAWKNSCQWSGMGGKRAISRAIAYKFKREVLPRTTVRETIAMVYRKRTSWPNPIPGLADYRGEKRRSEAERVSTHSLMG